jgi:hypothetical protein
LEDKASVTIEFVAIMPAFLLLVFIVNCARGAVVGPREGENSSARSCHRIKLPVTVLTPTTKMFWNGCV